MEEVGQGIEGDRRAAAERREGGAVPLLRRKPPFARWRAGLTQAALEAASPLEQLKRDPGFQRDPRFQRDQRDPGFIRDAPPVALETPGGVPHLRPLPAERDEAAVSRKSARRDAIFRRLLAFADVAGALSALLLTQALTDIGWQPALLYVGVLAAVVASKAIGLYDREELLIGKATLNEAPALFQLTTLYTLLITMLASASSEPLPAMAIGLLWLFLFIGALLWRALARQIARGFTHPERCLVLGSQAQATQVRAKFASHDSIHAEIVAFLPFEEFELERPRDTDFARYVIERDVHRVIVAQSDMPDRILQSVRYFKEYGLKVSVLPSILEVVGSSVEFDEIHGTTLLGVRSFGLSRSSRALKRVFDLVGSGLLLILGAPLLAAIAVAIKLNSRGTVLFSQTRVGRDGLRFKMYKFRTMYTGADRLRAELAELNETEGLFKVTNDPRITRVGRFLRSASLDELPQLINVLRGEMSLVGPRPLVEDEDQRVEGWHRRRLHLTPGMTGAWQIMGHARVPLREMVMMDYMYIVNWSLWSDIKILIQTAGHVLRRRGL
jgi:exopolysaccharide biosynthesis polyprenyl glycosylphosphotransferase